MLEHASFRRLLAGRTISVFGDGLYTVAVMWLVFDLTGSPFYTGLAGFLSKFPGMFGFLIGPLVDRARLNYVLTASEVVPAVLVLVIPLAAALGFLHVSVVLAVIPLVAFTNLFAGPAQHAALPRTVPEEMLVRANSMFSVSTKVLKASSEAIAGGLIASIGVMALYVIDAGTFALASLCFVLVATGDRTPGEDATEDLDVSGYLADIREGVEVLTGSVAGHMLVASFFANFLIGGTTAVLPAFADGIGGASVYGLLLASMTVGKILGSIVAPSVEGFPFGRTTITGFVVAGTLWIVAILVPGIRFTLALFTLAWIPTAIYNVSLAATVQTGVPDDRLGRVWAVATSGSNLIVPLGMLIGGAIGSIVGSRAVMFGGGVGLFLMASYWFAVPSLRRFGPPTDVSPGEFA